MATSEQKELYKLISLFTTDMLTDIIRLVYLKLGGVLMKTAQAKDIILSFVEEYCNNCAAWIYTGEDEYINKKFDEMQCIQLAGRNHPIDILSTIVMLTLSCLNKLDLVNTITGDFIADMDLIKIKIVCHVSSFVDLAQQLGGCTADHHHTPIQLGDKVFSFKYSKVQ